MSIENNIENNIINTKLDKDSEKYKVALKLINRILVNIGRDEVDDLTKFKDVNREDIIKDTNTISFMELQSELFKYFDKVKCGWYRRKTTKNYILTFIRYMCDDMGLNFEYHEYKKQNNKIVVSTVFYKIN